MFTDDADFLTWAQAQNYAVQEDTPFRVIDADDAIRWPDDVDRTIESSRRLPAVRAEEDLEQVAAQLARWRSLIDVLRDERKQAEEQSTLGRDYLTASDIVRLATDPATFYRDQLRPTPFRPSNAARQGTAVHGAIAHFYDRPASFDIDAIAQPDQMPIDMAPLLTSGDAERLFERFTSSRFAAVPQLAIEQGLEIELAGYPIRCVIDAVLDTSAIPGAPPVTIVDWKTGPRPDDTALLSRELQLGLYRLAWSKAHNTPLKDIAACFYFLGENEESRREISAGDLNETEITELITQYLEQGQQLMRKANLEQLTRVLK